MKRTFLAIMMLMGVSVAAAPVAEAALLTNSKATIDEISTSFDWANRIETSYSFDYSPVTTGGDGSVISGYASGTGAASGLTLYYYRIAYSLNAEPINERITQLTVDFPDIVTNFNLNSTAGADSSFYVVNSAGAPLGNYPNDVVNYTKGRIGFNFSCCNIIDPGETTTFFGAISTSGPIVRFASIKNSLDGNTTTTKVFAPVPEPATLLMIGSGLVGFGLFNRRRKNNA